MSVETPTAAPPLVTRARARDFRSIAECDVRLEPLTIFAGFNAAGKSNLLDVLRFVRDALTQSPSRAAAQRGGFGSLLRRSGPSEHTASSFLIGLHLAFGPDQGEATYEIRIGRDPVRKRHLRVVAEKLELSLQDGEARYSVDLDGDGREQGTWRSSRRRPSWQWHRSGSGPLSITQAQVEGTAWIW